MAEPTTPLAKSLLRRALPQSLLRAIRVYRGLNPAARSSMSRLWFRRLFARQPPLPALPPSSRVLFVCRGNILRSAVAEALFADLTRDGGHGTGFTAASAGTAAGDGSPADPRGLTVARELGLDLSAHRAQLLRQNAVDQADLILVMDYVVEAEVLGQFPAAERKVRLLGDWGSDQSRPREIRDPYSGTIDDVRAAFQLISTSVRDLVSSLSLSQAPASGNSRTGAA